MDSRPQLIELPLHSSTLFCLSPGPAVAPGLC